MFRNLIVAGALLTAFSASAQAEADSFTDNLGPRELALGESMRAGAVGSLSTVLNPAGLALNQQLVFEGSYGFRNADNASIASISACDSTTPVAGCFYYHYLSASPDVAGMDTNKRFHDAGFSAARALSPQLLLGTNTHFFDYNSNLAGEEDVRGYAIDVGMIFKPSPAVSVAGVGYNLIGTEAVQYPRGVATGLMLRPGQGTLGLSLDALWNIEKDADASGRYGGGLEYFLGSGQGTGYPIRAGGVFDAATDAGFATLGVGYANAKMGFDIGGRKQLSGDGDELIIQAGLRIVGPTPQRQR
jgi:hypothetical protein